MKKTLIGLLMLGIFQVACADAQQPRKGFLFYEDKQLPTIKPQPKKKKQPEKPVQAAPATPAKHEPFSAAWLREKMPILMDNALTNPTPENVRAYKYAERLMLDMASNYADMSKKVVETDPMLDESVRFPITAAARQSALFQIEKAKEEIVKNVAAGKAGLWFFFDSKCHFCNTQYQVMKLMEEKYSIKTKYISTDGGILAGMSKKQVVLDKNNIAADLGIKTLPAVVLAVPPDKTIIVAHGAGALSELEDKTVTAAIDLGLVPKELTDLAQLQKRGIITADDMQRAKNQMKDSDDPNELVRVINQAVQRRMQ